MYRWSKYNYATEKDNNIIVWNTYSGAIVKLEKNNYKKLADNDLITISSSEIACLVKNGFLIEDYEKLSKFETVNKKKNKITFTIALTKGCNAQCYYCYQHDKNNGVIREPLLSVREIDSVVDFIEKQSNDAIAMITWFGGEPLLKYDIIKYICKELALRKVKFVSSIITNGEQINHSLMNEYKDLLHLKDVQITIDGLYEKHDKRKKFQSGNVFEKIIRMIYDLLDNGVRVRIRINISKYNLNEANEIYQYLRKCYFNYKKCQIYFALVSDDNKLYDYAFTENERIQILDELYNKDYFCSINYKLPKRRTYFCGANSLNSYFLDIYGNLFLCEHDFWNFDKSIGTITEFNEMNYCKQKSQLSLNSKCTNCVFLPVCQGGCIRNGYNECPAFVFRAKSYLRSLLET